MAGCKARRRSPGKGARLEGCLRCHRSHHCLCRLQIWKPEYLEECLEEDQDPYPDTSGSGFEDESAQWSYVSRAVRLGQNKLAQLQQALPRRCRLTNSGHHRGLIKPWGD